VWSEKSDETDGKNRADHENGDDLENHGVNRENNQRVNRSRTVNGHAVLGTAS